MPEPETAQQNIIGVITVEASATVSEGPTAPTEGEPA